MNNRTMIEIPYEKGIRLGSHVRVLREAIYDPRKPCLHTALRMMSGLVTQQDLDDMAADDLMLLSHAVQTKVDAQRAGCTHYMPMPDGSILAGILTPRSKGDE